MFYIQQENKIVLFDENLAQLQNTLLFMPQYQGLDVLETDREIITLKDEFVFKDEVQEELAELERQRINKLTCTKRVFALMLQELGVTYSQLKELIATNEQAQLEWDLCVELERENPLLDIMASQLGITSEQLDVLFKHANGYLVQDESKGV